MNFKCKWCGEIKSEQDFIKRSVKEPYSEKNIRCCRTCNQERNRERYTTPEIREKQLIANTKWRKEHPDRMEDYAKEFNLRTPRNLKARSKVGHMLRRGYWVKQPCEVCGASDYVEAHHDSYAEAHWTTVRWLCKAHHEEWHKHLDPLKGAILEEPMADVLRLREKHDAIQRQMFILRAEARELKQKADSLEFDVWSQVQKLAVELFPKVFKRK